MQAQEVLGMHLVVDGKYYLADTWTVYEVAGKWILSCFEDPARIYVFDRLEDLVRHLEKEELLEDLEGSLEPGKHRVVLKTLNPDKMKLSDPFYLDEKEFEIIL